MYYASLIKRILFMYTKTLFKDYYIYYIYSIDVITLQVIIVIDKPGVRLTRTFDENALLVLIG